MKNLFFFAVLALVTACTSSESHTGPITGNPVKGQPKAYVDMCAREPSSVLCPQDVPLTQSNLNAHWCNMCAEDNNQYTWCKDLKCEPTTEISKPKIEDTETKSGAMTGPKVRLRADAYTKLCRDDPDSVLCN